MEANTPRRRGKSAKLHHPERGHSHLEKNAPREDTITLDLSSSVTNTMKNENGITSISQRKDKTKLNEISKTINEYPRPTTVTDNAAVQAKNTNKEDIRPSTTTEEYFEKSKVKPSFNQRRPQTSFRDDLKQKWKPKLTSNVNSELFSRTTFSISNGIDKMHLIVQEIDKELKEEQTTFEQYQSQLTFLKGKKEDLEKKVKEDMEWLQNAESNLQTFKQSYSSLFNEMGKIKSL